MLKLTLFQDSDMIDLSNISNGDKDHPEVKIDTEVAEYLAKFLND